MKNNLPHSLHYAPSSGLFGDPMPFYWQGEYHVFFQNSPAGLSFDGMQWAHVMTTDLLTWQNLPPALVPSPGGPDAFGCWTGCVREYEGVFHAFYTGCSGAGGRGQTVCHATSDDLVEWQKNPLNPLVQATAPYHAGEFAAWRDPQVLREPDGTFTMLLAADAAGMPTTLKGCVARLTSRDLLHWEPREPLYSPSAVSKCECPDLFELGGKYWLVYSHHGPQLRMAEDRLGPFTLAPVRQLDDLRHYATRTVEGEQGRRIAFSFLANQLDGGDDRKWSWGGVMALPRELSFDQDSGLRIGPVAEIAAVQGGRLATALGRGRTQVGNWTEDASSLEVTPSGADSELCVALLGDHTSCCQLELTIEFGTAEAAGIVICSDSGMRSCYLIEVDLAGGVLALSRLADDMALAPSRHQSVSLESDMTNRVPLRVIFDHDAVEIFAGRRTCLSGRLTEWRAENSCWGLFARFGSVSFNAVAGWSLRRPEPTLLEQEPTA